MQKKKSAALVTLLLVFELVSVEGLHHGRRPGCQMMPGSVCNISLNDRDLQRFVFMAAQAFNDEANDAFLFKPAAILSAQRQIVKGVLYMVDLELSRTVCFKQINASLSQCDFQPPGPLHQTLLCHSDIWSIPWTHQVQTRTRC